MEEKFEKVAALVLQRLESFLEREEAVDPQKCKHITSTLKDLRELQAENAGPQQLVVVFDRDTEEAAK